jgi:NADH-quinone oxidoreductase subunit L
MNKDLILLIPLLPLFGAVINGLVGRYMPRWLVGFLACSTIGVSFLFSIIVFRYLAGIDATGSVTATLYPDWITIDDLAVNVSFVLDRLSAVMILVVSGVSFLIHIYSIGYMGHDKGYARYFAYLNLFCFAMLLLVLADNLLLMFVGWEGVGLCSYLLIGFWFEDEEKAKAGKKAFIVNRIGDFGFILGIFFTFYYFGTLNFSEIGKYAAEFSLVTPEALKAAATVIGLLLFVGAMGKSAQIPLYVWLPDAMAGPTPVSALIHAATMVTAGVYMIARMHFVYDASEAARTVVLMTGLFTAFYAATIALVQNDIKKVLAYSTISQLGYMFVAMGLGAYFAGIFHLVTHAFFKALLFLGAGSVIHVLSGEQDIRKMGGMKNYLVWTTTTFAAGTFAIAGFPLFSGWFSKDEILYETLKSGNLMAWILGVMTAMLTAFYMVRLFSMVFLGTTKVKKDDLEKLHESPASMTFPLFILAVLSIFGGLIPIKHYLEPYFEGPATKVLYPVMSEWAHRGIVTLISLGVIIGVFYLYAKRRDIPEKAQKKLASLHDILSRKYMVDEFYDATIVRPLNILAKFFAWFDKWVIDGLVNLSGYLVRAMSFMASKVETGYVQIYAFFLLIGLITILGYLFWIG